MAILCSCWLSQFSSSSPCPPLSDTLKLVRMLVKHLHYFTNSCPTSDRSPLDPLKRSLLPSLRPQLYSVFKFIFSHWPNDSSFRLVLETWLSFLQPWRYTARATALSAPDNCNNTAMVEPGRWQPFVCENLLFYSSMLHLLLPRFFRMDLTSAKNAYMLFRVSKVLSQPGVAELIQAAEQGLGTQGGITGIGVGQRLSFTEAPQSEGLL